MQDARSIFNLIGWSDANLAIRHFDDPRVNFSSVCSVSCIIHHLQARRLQEFTAINPMVSFAAITITGAKCQSEKFAERIEELRNLQQMGLTLSAALNSPTVSTPNAQASVYIRETCPCKRKLDKVNGTKVNIIDLPQCA